MVTKTGRRRNVDALPEFYHFEDTGCEVAPACLRCPLPQCKYDDPGLLTRMRREARNDAVLHLLGQGVSVREVAGRTGLGPRAVHRLKAGMR